MASNVNTETKSTPTQRTRRRSLSPKVQKLNLKAYYFRDKSQHRIFCYQFRLLISPSPKYVMVLLVSPWSACSSHSIRLQICWRFLTGKCANCSADNFRAAEITLACSEKIIFVAVVGETRCPSTVTPVHLKHRESLLLHLHKTSRARAFMKENPQYNNLSDKRRTDNTGSARYTMYQTFCTSGAPSQASQDVFLWILFFLGIGTDVNEIEKPRQCAGSLAEPLAFPIQVSYIAPRAKPTNNLQIPFGTTAAVVHRATYLLDTREDLNIIRSSMLFNEWQNRVKENELSTFRTVTKQPWPSNGVVLQHLCITNSNKQIWIKIKSNLAVNVTFSTYFMDTI